MFYSNISNIVILLERQVTILLALSANRAYSIVVSFSLFSSAMDNEDHCDTDQNCESQHSANNSSNQQSSIRRW